MAEYIEREHLKDKLSRYLNAPHVRGGYSIGQGMRVAIKSCIAMLDEEPTAEVELVRPDLRKAVKLLGKNYERGLNSDYVRNPVAWALYQTWKEMDGGTDNEK